MKVLVTGCRGQLGSLVVELLESQGGIDVVATDRGRLDVTRPEKSLQAATALCPDWIVNCTAYNDVERAESAPADAFLVNDTAVGHLADAAAACGARLLHISTDYVFSGEFAGAPPRPYTEADTPAPLSQYGASKRAGEVRLEGHPARAVVLRTSWLYGRPGRSFLTTMLRLGEESSASGRPVRVVNDQIGVPTDAWSLAHAIGVVLDSDLGGIVHASSHGAASWFDFAGAIFAAAGLRVVLEPMALKDYPARARRPQYSVLDNCRLRGAGLDVFPDWRRGLERAWPAIEEARRARAPARK